jgi:hypothetical protein
MTFCHLPRQYSNQTRAWSLALALVSNLGSNPINNHYLYFYLMLLSHKRHKVLNNQQYNLRIETQTLKHNHYNVIETLQHKQKLYNVT